MKRYLFWFAVCVLAGCGHTGDDYIDGIIVFDNAKKYPTIDLKLSDVANLTYIPLKGVDEGYPVPPFGRYGRLTYIADNEIYFVPDTEGIYVFDMDGKPRRKMTRPGRGPGEYGNGILNFWADPENNSVYAIGTNNLILEYDAASLEFITSYRHEFPGRPNDVIPLNRDHLVAHRKRPRPYETDPATFYLFSGPDWKSQPLPPKMERPFDFDDSFMLIYPGLTYGQGGVFMNNIRCDTIFWIDRSTMEVSPRMVDISNYSGTNMMVLPSFETNQYVFFSLVYQRFDRVNEQRVPMNYPYPKESMFVFDKEQEKIFRIPLKRTDLFPDNGSEYLNPNQKFSWAFDECWLTCWNTTLNDNYGVVMYQAYELLDNMDILTPELKKIAETLNENDNPVLALIKLK